MDGEIDHVGRGHQDFIERGEETVEVFELELADLLLAHAQQQASD